MTQPQKGPKQKKKLTAEQKANKRRRKLEWETVFMNGKQVRVKRAPMIEGMPADEFIRKNADPMWLHANGMWEHIREPE